MNSDSTANVQEPAEKAPLRVLHFVTGGFSGGATQVAIALVNAAQASSTMTPLLALRRKSHSPKERIAQLQRDGVPLVLVAGWSHIATIWHLARVCRQFRPDILVAHGFSEHLWGRYAGLLAKVPYLVQVEHNTRERYTRWRLMQSRWLAKHTVRIVGCSEGVEQALLAQGLPAARILAILNGIALAPFAGASAVDFSSREPALVMVARLSKQKDHATLIHALALLRARGLTPVLHLAGGGKSAHRKPLEQLVNALGLQDQVRFLGVIRNVPALLMQSQIAVLSTHYEGMPLALIEGMAAGCAVVASHVPGVREIIREGIDGILVAPKDPAALADALEALLKNPEHAAKLACAARDRALSEFSVERMHQGYERLFLDIAGRS